MRGRIFLIRHGESADKQHSLSDFDRVLTSNGKNSIELLGKSLKREELSASSIISSTARRAKETSQILAREIEFPTDKIVFDGSLYNGMAEAYLDVINGAPSSSIIIGHNPAISDVIGKITGDYSLILLAGQCAILEINDDQEARAIKQPIQLIGPFH